MPSHRKDRGCGYSKREAARPADKCNAVAGQGRAGKRKKSDLKENANRYLLDKALEDLEAYMADYRRWDQQRNEKLNAERFARLQDNKRILESLRDNASKNTTLLVQTVINTVKCSLYECFDAVHYEQREDALVKSISDLRLLQD